MFLLLLSIKVLVCHLSLASAEAIGDNVGRDTRNTGEFSQQETIKSAWIITPETSITRQGRFTVDANDMVTVLVSKGTRWETDGLEVASGASVLLRSLNVKANNGSIGLFAHGASVALKGAEMSSSGPVGHSVFAAAGSFITMNGTSAITTGPRSSIAAASTILSRVQIENSEGLTFGSESPCLFSLGGALSARQFRCVSSQSPFLVVDSTNAVWQDRLAITLDQVEAGAGGLAAIVMFDNTTRPNKRPMPQLRLRDTVIQVMQPEAVGMWFSNTWGMVDLTQSTIMANGPLVRAVAAGMPVLQDLSGFEKRQSGDESTAVGINVVQSSLGGNIVVSGKGFIDWNLKEMSEWIGSAVAEHSYSHVHVSLSQNSTWRLTNHTHVQKFMNDDQTLGNIDSQGFNLSYCKDVSNIVAPVSALAGGGFAVGLPVC
ncbi:hypothetical protein PspLS_07928 [Pyricularia sp. CBS 133598]|nr:hypothetical protein PspLS_07928 [Pyricularia sp. CBS 133598]